MIHVFDTVLFLSLLLGLLIECLKYNDSKEKINPTNTMRGKHKRKAFPNLLSELWYREYKGESTPALVELHS